MKQRQFKDVLPLAVKRERILWSLYERVFFRSSPRWLFNSWRVLSLRAFGARIGSGCRIDSTARIWLPRNLTLGDQVCLGFDADIYCVDKIRIGNSVAISQRSFLCSASHSIESLGRPLVTAPIDIQDHAWICAEAFVGMNVTVGTGAVVAARAVVHRDVAPWQVVAGNPAQIVKKRVIEENVG